MAISTTEVPAATSAGVKPRGRSLPGVRVLRRFPFLRNIVVLVSGTGVAAALMVMSTPVLSRLYQPELFGALAVFTSVISVLATAGSLCYEMAIPLAEDDDTANDVLILALIVLSFASVLLSAVVAWFSDPLVHLLNCRPLRPYTWLLPVAFFGGGVYQILSYWALRKQAFGRIASTRVSQSAAMAGTQVGAGLLSYGLVGLLVGDLLGRVSGAGMMLRLAASHRRSAPLDVQRIRAAAVRYAKFPKYSAIANLLTSLSTNIPVLMLSRIFGPTVAGLYAVTFRVLRAPMVLIGQAVAQVFFARAASMAKDAPQLRRLTEGTTLTLFAAGLPVFAFLALDGPSIFAAVLGAPWRTAGAYGQLLAPWFLLWMVANPLSSLLTIREWQGQTLMYSVLECAVQALALGIGAASGSDWICIAVLGAAASGFSLITIARFLTAGYSGATTVLKQAAGLLAGAVACAATARAFIAGSGVWQITGRSLILFTLYAALLWMLRRRFIPAASEVAA
jgi:lipopolysaccharide exporter